MEIHQTHQEQGIIAQPPVTAEALASPERTHETLTQILDLNPQIARALTLGDLCRTLVAEMTGGRIELNPQVRQMMFPEPAIRTFNDVMNNSTHSMTCAQIAMRMGGKWLEHAMRTMRRTDPNGSTDFAAHILRASMQEIQPAILNFIPEKPP